MVVARVETLERERGQRERRFFLPNPA